MLFEIKDLKKAYGERTVLDIPDLYFEKGFIYALLGPNGSGKTTLLEILSLLVPPTTGRIRYKDKEVDFTGNNLADLRREIVMVHQNPVLFTTTVYKNLEFGLMVRGIPKKERTRIIEDSLDLVAMRQFMGAEAHRLSGGETQRVAIAQALVCSPNVMFFDEPTANVDVENQITIERIIGEINSQKGISVIFTTHNLTQASKLSHKVISLLEGRTVATIFENIFSVNVVCDENGSHSCLVQGKVKFLIRPERQGNVRLSIDPLKIKVLKDEETANEKNIFQGRLVQLTDEHDYVRAIVDIGIPLNVLLPRNEVRDRSLYVGNEVGIFCPLEAIQVF